MATKKVKAAPKKSGGILGYLQDKAQAKVLGVRKANDRTKARRIDEAVYGKPKAASKKRGR